MNSNEQEQKPSPGASQEIFVLANGQVNGPLTPAEARARLQTGEWNEEMSARVGSDSKWITLGQVLGRLGTAAGTMGEQIYASTPAPPNLPPPPGRPFPQGSELANPAWDIPQARRSGGLGWMLLLLLAGLVVYALVPYRVFYTLDKAVGKGEADVLEQYVDFEAVSNSITPQIGRRLNLTSVSDASATPIPDTQWAKWIEGRIGTYLSSARRGDLSRLLQTNGWWQLRTGIPMFRSPTKFVAVLKGLHFKGRFSKPESLQELRVPALYEVSGLIPEVRLIFTFKNWTWRLTAVDVPMPIQCSARRLIPPPLIVQQPQSKAAREGDGVQFQVSAQGAGPLTYRWQHNGHTSTVFTSPTYRIASATAASAGTYVVEVANPGGSITSAPVTLTVIPRPSWTGTWRLSEQFGLRLVQRGNVVTGTCLPDAFPIRATVEGASLRGFYTGHQRNGQSYTATFDLRMSEDGQSFTGSMRNGLIGRTFQWQGIRQQP